jgi:hypothetical protein
VKKFVRIPNLPNKNIGALVDELIYQDNYVDTPPLLRNIMASKEKFEETLKVLEEFVSLFQPLMGSKFFKGFEQVIKFEDEKAKEIVEENKEYIQDLAFRVKGQVDEEFVNSYEKNLLSMSSKFEEETGVKLVVSKNLFVCPNCKSRLWDKEIADKKCLSCNFSVSQNNVKRIPVYRINDKIKIVWETGLWFEAYLAILLNKCGYKTWTGVHVMGASGILHEIDVVAIKDGTLIVCECKTGKISRNDVFNFYTKVGDTKAHLSILALIDDFPDPETRNFVKRNPSIISLEKMGEKDSSLVVSELEQRLQTNG